MPVDEPSPVLVEIGLRRDLRDEEGRWWVVRELDAPQYDRRRSRSLIFERDEVVRRVRSFPADWFQQSDDALCRLMLGT